MGRISSADAAFLTRSMDSLQRGLLQRALMQERERERAQRAQLQEELNQMRREQFSQTHDLNEKRLGETIRSNDLNYDLAQDKFSHQKGVDERRLEQAERRISNEDRRIAISEAYADMQRQGIEGAQAQRQVRELETLFDMIESGAISPEAIVENVPEEKREAFKKSTLGRILLKGSVTPPADWRDKARFSSELDRIRLLEDDLLRARQDEDPEQIKLLEQELLRMRSGGVGRPASGGAGLNFEEFQRWKNSK